MIINHNISALNTYRQLSSNNVLQNKSLEKLSSGFRINRAGDDAAGLAISEKMRGQIRGLNQASRNAQDGISLIQTAEGALNETHAILQRMRELAVQSATDTNTNEDRGEIQKEINELATEITRISTDTQFNKMNLLDGTFGGKFFHIGANKDQNATIGIENMSAAALEVTLQDADAVKAEGTYGGVTFTAASGGVAGNGELEINVVVSGAGSGASAAISSGVLTITLGASGTGEITASGLAGLTVSGYTLALAEGADGDATVSNGTVILEGGAEEVTADPKMGIDVSTRKAANEAVEIIDKALGTVSTERSKLGAMQNRLEHTIANLDTSAENLQASESRIRDVDMAKEMMEFTKMNILSQAATAMLAQANQQPQMVLQLLR
ncbi:MAG: flagellin [Bacillota bacterium]